MPYYHPGPDAPEIRYLLERRRELGGFVPERRSAHRPLELPDDQDLRRGQEGLRQADGRHHHGLRPAAPGPDAGQGHRRPRIVPIVPDEARTFGMDSFFPTAKIYNPRGQNYTAVDRELFLAYKESAARPAPAHRDQRGRLDGRLHRGGHQLRHPRRADDPGLRLLLDVRLPADRRRDVGGHGPDGPRLHHRGHRRADHPDRGGSAARRRALPDPGRDQPGDEGLRPGVRLRDRPHRPSRPRADVRTGLRRSATSCTT